MKIFREKISDFMERKPNLTMLGLAWALWWRLQILVLLLFGLIVAASLLFSM